MQRLWAPGDSGSDGGDEGGDDQAWALGDEEDGSDVDDNDGEWWAGAMQRARSRSSVCGVI